jgi:hypothetical protein
MMPHRLATTYTKIHHSFPPLEPSPPTSESSGYLNVLEDNDTDASMSSEEEEEEAPPPTCGPLQATLLGTFETAHREASTRAVHAITLEQKNTAIANRVAELSVEFAAKEAAAKKLMAAERRAARELEEKVACDAGYPAWQAYWRRCREEAEAAAVAKRTATAVARKEATSQPSEPRVFVDLSDDGPSTSGAGH